ncbi:putative glycosyltransferase EpsH [compost metagenome]
MAFEEATGSERAVVLVDVCICTFQRLSLTETLNSLLAQTLPADQFRVIVADNDHDHSARTRVEAALRGRVDFRYLHAPARNISVARNACLDAATADYVAWIDDDEVADPEWLERLISALRAGEWDAVFGPVRAVYPSDAPTWATAADLHSARAVETRQGVDTGYTSNALVRRAVIGARRFDPELGRSGGEDTDFFTGLHAAGARFAAAPEAVVREAVGRDRLRLNWLLRRAFRSGQTHARRYLQPGGQRVAQAVIALTKSGACGGLVAVNVARPSHWRRAMVRGALHLGVFARLAGVREGRLY